MSSRKSPASESQAWDEHTRLLSEGAKAIASCKCGWDSLRLQETRFQEEDVEPYMGTGSKGEEMWELYKRDVVLVFH